MSDLPDEVESAVDECLAFIKVQASKIGMSNKELIVEIQDAYDSWLEELLNANDGSKNKP